MRGGRARCACAVPLRKSRAEKLIGTVRRAKDEKKYLLDAALFLFQDLIRVAKFQPASGSAKPYEVRCLVLPIVWPLLACLFACES